MGDYPYLTLVIKRRQNSNLELGDMNNENQPIPKQGDTFEMTVEDISSAGEAVGRFGSYVVFVPEAAPGDRVKVKLVERKKSYGRGVIEELLEPSQSRVTPRCDSYRRCGGCQLQHIDYSVQLAEKTKAVKDAFQRLAKLDTDIRPCVGMDDPYHYRTKVQWVVRRHEKKIRLGYFQPRSHRFVAPDTCPVLAQKIVDISQRVEQLLQEFNWPVFQEQSRRGSLRHIGVRGSLDTDEFLVVVVSHTKEIEGFDTFAHLIQQACPEVVGVVLNWQGNGGNKIFGGQNPMTIGRDYYYEEKDGVKFQVPATGFFQVNPWGLAQIYKQLKFLLQGRSIDMLWDFYAGVGSLGLWCLKQGLIQRYVGVESHPGAVEQGRQNALLNGLDKAVFEQCLVEAYIPRLESPEWPEILLLDPPRKGVDKKALASIADSSIQEIIYISCSPATLARDCRILKDAGFEPLRIQPVDMFPNTSHVELITHLVRS